MTRPHIVLALLPLPLLAGCSGLHYEPFTYTAVGDMRPGPGLFSGADGEFVVYRELKDPSASSGGKGASRGMK
jgi:hypothetical protein